MPRGRIVHLLDGDPGATVRLAGTNSPQEIPSGVQSANNKTAHFCLVTVELFEIRFGFGGVTVTQGDSGLGHTAFPGDIIELSSSKQISEFSFINKYSGSNAAIQMTPEFG